MSEAINKGYIKKKDKGSGKYEDLYLEGIELLQQFSGAEWTDYNAHDPGVTILENIAYTLTNLSYKTSLPVKDILRESKGSKLESGDNGFFIPSDILTTNPITRGDFSKLFIDQITNVKNVWVKTQIDAPTHFTKNLHQSNLKGLYHIFIEMSNYTVDPVELKEEESRIINEVRELFHAHRNLCEDLYDVTIFKPFQLQMKLKLTLADMANGEEVFANIYYKINDHLTHEVKFCTLWELQDKKETINSIFDGPLLENGFISDGELRERLDSIVISNIVKLIAKVKGVISVDFFELSFKNNDTDKGEFTVVTEDRIAIPENHSPVLMFPELSTDLTLENDGVKFSPDLKEVKKQLSYIQAMNYGSFKSVSRASNTIEIPEGESLGIADYFPIREQFPTAYGIGQFGLATGLPNSSYAKANQLKAYLLPFDQLMNNFLSQLSHIYTIYDVKDNGINSYFSKELEDMPELVQLIKSDELESEEDALNNWGQTLNKLNSQFDETAIQRLNDVADNLLARFSEEFPTYALKKIHINCYGKRIGSKNFENELLASKRALIANYGQLSYNRAKAYDYTQAVNVTDNLEDIANNITPGIIQKTAILMGLKNFETRPLSKVIAESGIKIYQKKEGLDIISEKLEIIHPKEDIEVIAVDDIIIIDENVKNLRDSIYYSGNSGSILKEVLKYGVIADNYQIKQTTNDKQNSYYVMFKQGGKKTKVLNVSDSKEEAKKSIKYAINFLVDLNEKSEGLYLIEHLLLSPPYHGNNFGFSFSIPLIENTSIEFNPVNLQSNEKRNIDVNTIMANLTGKGSMQFRLIGKGEKYVIQILTKEGTQLAVSPNMYDDKQTAQAQIDAIVKQLYTFKKGQFAEAVIYYAHYGDNKVDENFFSFQMSVILPSWPVRFQDDNFKTKFENIVYEQAPVHIAFQLYWMDLMEMADFEKTYYKWLGLVANNEQTAEQMKQAYELITKIQQYHQPAQN
jgi:hypothetical protein|tara:strand:+ start:1231 stop:4146 length:2916 start_codon:yes stop_codon:yes gene_type:complete